MSAGFFKQLACPACGAPVKVTNRFVTLVTCDFCHQSLWWRDGHLDPTGRTAKLADLPSRLFVEATGILAGRRFQVLGRLRYAYEAGRWDEWFLSFEDEQPGWLVEDEGTFQLLRRTVITAAVPAFATIRVGATMQIGEDRLFVTEKRSAHIAGGEGQLSFRVLPGEQVFYVDGVAVSGFAKLDGPGNQRQVSIEFMENEIELLLGTEIAPGDLQVDEDER